MARPGAALVPAANMTELSYADGAIVYGRVAQMGTDKLHLCTGFSDELVACALAGASLLRFGSRDTEIFTSNDDMDELFTSAGRLRGRLAFDLAGTPLSWYVPGVAKPLRLAKGGAARIQRSRQSRSRGGVMAVDTDRFPCVLHLKNGEIIPCQVLSYDKETLSFESPFILQRTLDTRHIKAIEFMPLRRREAADSLSRETSVWLKHLPGPEQETSIDVDPAKLERALTVPRFNRNSPPSHIFMARNGDLKRGSLLGLSTQSIQFESKLRKQIIPVDRMACVVNVCESEHEPNESPETTINLTGKVWAILAGGSILIFEALESRDGRLLGRSEIYGDMAIPCDIIQDLSIGGFEETLLRSLFDGWVVRPAREPAFGVKKTENNEY
jgi:hypothetical protein